MITGKNLLINNLQGVSEGAGPRDSGRFFETTFRVSASPLFVVSLGVEVSNVSPL
jgi:hypothetical protein